MRYAVGLFTLAFMAAPAAAQDSVISIYEIGTAADRYAALNLGTLERDGDFARTLASVEYVEPLIEDKGERWGQWLRVQVNCKTYEVRQLLYNSYSDMGDTRDGRAFASAAPQTLKPNDVIVTSMCGQGEMKPLWPLYNSEFSAAPETRPVMDEDAQKYPWKTLGGLDQSFVRMRALELAKRHRGAVAYFPKAKPVAGLPATTGFLASPFRYTHKGRWSGAVDVQGGYVELPSVVQIADDLYFYSIAGVGRAKVSNAATLRYDLGVDVRCKGKPQQRLFAGEWFKTDGKVSSFPIPAKAIVWHDQLFEFSKAICAKKFDKNARRLPDAKAVIADLSAAYKP